MRWKEKKFFDKATKELLTHFVCFPNSRPPSLGWLMIKFDLQKLDSEEDLEYFSPTQWYKGVGSLSMHLQVEDIVVLFVIYIQDSLHAIMSLDVSLKLSIQ